MLMFLLIGLYSESTRPVNVFNMQPISNLKTQTVTWINKTRIHAFVQDLICQVD